MEAPAALPHVRPFLPIPSHPAPALLPCTLRASPTDKAIPPPRSPCHTPRPRTWTANLGAQSQPARTVTTTARSKKTQMELSQGWMGLNWPTPATYGPAPTPAMPAPPVAHGQRARPTCRPPRSLAWAPGTSHLSPHLNQDILSSPCLLLPWATTAPLWGPTLATPPSLFLAWILRSLV